MLEHRRLARGLEALIGTGAAFGADSGAGDTSSAGPPAPPIDLSIDRIELNPYQPRKNFEAGDADAPGDDLQSLQESIRTHGVLQPLLVRQVGDRFQLIAGERRLRAAQLAGIGHVPVRVIDLNDQQVLEAALVENIQRVDLNPIEKAQGFRDYLDRFRMTQEALAQRLGLDRSTISNLVNLLDLTPEVQDAVRRLQISLGHAKVLKGITDPDRQIALCREIIARGHSVRATEDLVRQDREEQPTPSASKRNRPTKTSHVQSIENDLRQRLATRVEIRLRERHKGRIILSFESNDDFERLLEVLRG